MSGNRENVRAHASKRRPLTFSRMRSSLPVSKPESEGHCHGLMGSRAIGIQPTAEARTAGSHPAIEAMGDDDDVAPSTN